MARAKAGPVRIDPHEDRRRRTILTPEGVRLPLTIASRGSRAAALLLDLVMIYAAMAATTAFLLWIGLSVLGIKPERLDDKTALGGALQALVITYFIAIFLFRNGWFLLFELGPRGATPGKRIVGIRVAARHGERLTTEAVIARNLLRDIELFMPLLFIGGALMSGDDVEIAAWAGLGWFLIFVLFPFFNRDALRCGDVIAGTWVVEAPRRKLEQALSIGQAAGVRSAATGTEYRFSEAELAIYGEYELQVLERVLRDDRPEAMADVAEAICRKIGWNVGRGDERAFLDAYYTQLRARLEHGMRFGKRKADKNTPGAG